MAVGVYAGLWGLACGWGPAPATGFLSVVIGQDITPFGMPRGAAVWTLFLLQTVPLFACGVWAGLKTTRSEVVHRRLMIGGTAAFLLGGASAVGWGLAYLAAPGTGLFAGVLEWLLLAASVPPSSAGAAFAFAGAWGRWGMNRTAAGGVVDGDE